MTKLNVAIQAPTSAADWQAEEIRFQNQLAELQTRIEQERGRRKQFAIDSASGDAKAQQRFDASFDHEATLTREVDKLASLVQHCQERAAKAEAAELAALEQARQAALDAINKEKLRLAISIDQAMAKLFDLLTEYDMTSAECRRLGCRDARRTVDVATRGIKYAGLGSFLKLETLHRPASMESHVRSYMSFESVDLASTDRSLDELDLSRELFVSDESE